MSKLRKWIAIVPTKWRANEQWQILTSGLHWTLYDYWKWYPHLSVPYIFGTRGLVSWYIGNSSSWFQIGNWKMRDIHHLPSTWSEPLFICFAYMKLTKLISKTSCTHTGDVTEQDHTEIRPRIPVINLEPKETLFFLLADAPEIFPQTAVMYVYIYIFICIRYFSSTILIYLLYMQPTIRVLSLKCT